MWTPADVGWRPRGPARCRSRRSGPTARECPAVSTRPNRAGTRRLHHPVLTHRLGPEGFAGMSRPWPGPAAGPRDRAPGSGSAPGGSRRRPPPASHGRSAPRRDPLGDPARLFGEAGPGAVPRRCSRVVERPGAAHLVAQRVVPRLPLRQGPHPSRRRAAEPSRCAATWAARTGRRCRSKQVPMLEAGASTSRPSACQRQRVVAPVRACGSPAETAPAARRAPRSSRSPYAGSPPTSGRPGPAPLHMVPRYPCNWRVARQFGQPAVGVADGLLDS